MKSRAWIVLVADQRRSRRDTDRVPEVLRLLQDVPCALAFERTAGDEIQGLLQDPKAAVLGARALSRTSGWRIGLGVGEVETPLPSSTREARGEAYVNARQAIDAAHRNSVGLAMVGEGVRDAESALLMLRALWLRRSAQGWELADLLDGGLNQTQAAQRLGISASAISQRASAAALAESARGEALVSSLLGQAVAANR